MLNLPKMELQLIYLWYSNGNSVLGRLEKVNLNNQYSKVKIMGTVLCVLGALTMSIMQSISTAAPEQNSTLPLSKTPSGFVFNTQKMIGCFYLVVAVVILSSNVVLQVTCFIKCWRGHKYT